MDVVASCNGIVCLAKPPWADGIRIWNPATRQSKRVYLPRLDPSVFDNVSLGLGFDPAVNDFKLISILLYKRNVAGQPRTEVYVYSLDTGKWRAIKAEPPFTYLGTKCEAVVKGIPYWVTQIDDEFGVRLAFVWFDFENELFHTLPFPAIPWEEMRFPCFADLSGSLAVVVSSLVPFVDEPVDVYLMEDGNTFLYDPETGRVEHLEVGQVKRNSLALFNYTESIVVIKDAKSQPFEPLEEKMLETMNRHGLHVKLLQGRDGEIQYGYVDDGRINIVDLNLLFSSDDDEP
ncbi:hypothetical protein RJ640_001350 [Escallonia rubra]|uniref:F-box associated beta-propeller type 1 domain-containing protein n=1 Tax=Escallonia rubra TaxID=112253 RepID=A0AA88UPZ5_9ASTE|nr:hypothetical protein RJ640_001350 [Escallonia rubra]